MEENNLPYISIIITAYNRKEFLLNAIKSAVNQTLDKKYYEIIVIKNYKDDMIDNYIQDNEIIGIITNTKSLGGKLVEALNIAKGNVISFLEDDDLFSNDKLEIVYNKFKENKDLTYYHNSMIPIDHKNKLLKGWYKQEDKEIIYNYKSTRKIIRRGIRYGSHNLSSISISKAIFLIDAHIIFNFTYAIDYGIVLLALNSGRLLISDKHKLTLYRVHNSSINTFNKNYNEFMEQRCLTHKEEYSFIEHLLNSIDSKNINIQSFYTLMLYMLKIKAKLYCKSDISINLLKYLSLFPYRRNNREYLINMFIFILSSKKLRTLTKIILTHYINKHKGIKNETG